MYFLSINHDRVEVTRSHRDAAPHVIKSVADFRAYIAAEALRSGVKVEDIEVMASSSMDFPAEFTNDPAVIALALELRA